MKRRTFSSSSVLAGLACTMTSSARSDAASEDLRRCFERIHRWLGANAPKIRPALRGPVTSADLADLERTAGTLPKDLISLYQWHDGIDSKKTANLFYGFSFESAHDTVERMRTGVRIPHRPYVCGRGNRPDLPPRFHAHRHRQRCGSLFRKDARVKSS